MAAMASRGQEALYSERVELYGHSNHIHFFVREKSAREVIPKSIHLIAGRTGQEYSQRKKRKGAFREA